MDSKLISVIIPVYNSEVYLFESVNSIIKQTYTNIEIIIIYDESKDNTQRIILEFEKNDKRIKCFKNNSNAGLVNSLNLGLDLANGFYIARMDADDIAYSNRLEKQYEFMEAHQEVGLCGSWIKFFGDSNKIIRKYQIDEEIKSSLIFDSSIVHPTFFMRSSVISNNGIRYSSRCEDNWNYLDIFCEDYDFIVKLIDYTKFANIPEVLLNYRVHKNSISVKNNVELRTKGRIFVQKTVFEKFYFDKICDEELIIHHNFCYYKLDYTKKEFSKISDWLFKIINLKDKQGNQVKKSVVLNKLFSLIKHYLKRGHFVLFYKSVICYLKIYMKSRNPEKKSI
jgi:glycosyltransferase involved in cell wall biosynthesis